MRPSRINFSVTPAVTPPAVSVKIPSVSARSLIAETISGSETSSAHPPLSRINLIAYGPSAELPIASERRVGSKPLRSITEKHKTLHHAHSAILLHSHPVNQ